MTEEKNGVTKVMAVQSTNQYTERFFGPFVYNVGFKVFAKQFKLDPAYGGDIRVGDIVLVEADRVAGDGGCESRNTDFGVESIYEISQCRISK